jgi:hypothetical protein
VGIERYFEYLSMWWSGVEWSGVEWSGRESWK